MSEFSESYHLQTGDVEKAVSTLRQAGLAGYVFPAANGWVSFVADQGQFAPDMRIVRHSHALLLHYVYAEDHGWSFAAFERGQPVTSYGCGWDRDLEISADKLSIDPLRAIAASHGNGSIESVVSQFHPAGAAEAMSSELAKRFAQAVGLTHYDWLDFDHTARAFHESRRELDGVIEVKVRS